MVVLMYVLCMVVTVCVVAPPLARPPHQPRRRPDPRVCAGGAAYYCAQQRPPITGGEVRPVRWIHAHAHAPHHACRRRARRPSGPSTTDDHRNPWKQSKPCAVGPSASADHGAPPVSAGPPRSDPAIQGGRRPRGRRRTGRDERPTERAAGGVRGACVGRGTGRASYGPAHAISPCCGAVCTCSSSCGAGWGCGLAVPSASSAGPSRPDQPAGRGSEYGTATLDM
jgi:hypothetical protein